MYTAYNPEGAAAITNPAQMDTILTGDEKAGFIAYLGTLDDETETPNQAQKDLDGYLAALNIVDTTVKKDSNTAMQALTNGYSDPELVALLNQFLPETTE